MTDRHSLIRRGSSDISDSAKWVNTSGAVVPAYGVVQFRSNFASGLNQAKKPNGDPGLYFANGPVDIADTKEGESLIWNKARLVLIDGSPIVGTTVGPTSGSWKMSEDGTGFVVMHQPVGGIGAVMQVGGGGGGTLDIEFVVVSMDCYTDPWIILAEVTWYSGGCTAAIPGEDQYGRVEIQNRCNIANHFNKDNIVGLAGTATYRYPRTGECAPAWRLDDICGEGDCLA